MNILKKSLKKKRLLGYWSILPLSQIHEIMSEAGYEFSIVDLEHGTYSFQEALESVIAIKASGMFSLIRPSSHDSKEILRCLELNPDGICIPQVSTYEEAKNVVSACLYPPEGTRGSSGFTRSTSYGKKDFNKHTINQNKDLFIQILIEDKAGLNEIEKISSIKGLDSIYFGTYDIAKSLGLNNQNSLKVSKLISNAMGKVKNNKIIFGQVAVDINQYNKLDRNINFVPMGVDCGIFLKGSQDLIKGINK